MEECLQNICSLKTLEIKKFYEKIIVENQEVLDNIKKFSARNICFRSF